MSFVPPTVTAVLSGGDSPGSSPLTVGQVTFNSIECPEKLPIGAVEQKVAVIELLGGGRVVQTLGIQPKQVEWTGTFWGNTVTDRVQELRSYVVSGQTYPVVWYGEQWTAVVKEFVPTYLHKWRCEYHIVLEIVTSQSGELTSTNFPTADAQVDAMNDQIQIIVDNIAADANAQGWGTVSVLWQDYLILLGQLYESQQPQAQGLLDF